MRYILNNSGAFGNIKLTDTGRRKLAEGKLTFTAWGIGDSELKLYTIYSPPNHPKDRLQLNKPQEDKDGGYYKKYLKYKSKYLEFKKK